MTLQVVMGHLLLLVGLILLSHEVRITLLNIIRSKIHNPTNPSYNEDNPSL